jgi:hypothetical protein
MCAVLESDQEGTNSYTGGRDARIMVCNLSQPRHKSLLDPPSQKTILALWCTAIFPVKQEMHIGGSWSKVGLFYLKNKLSKKDLGCGLSGRSLA